MTERELSIVKLASIVRRQGTADLSGPTDIESCFRIVGGTLTKTTSPEGPLTDWTIEKTGERSFHVRYHLGYNTAMNPWSGRMVLAQAMSYLLLQLHFPKEEWDELDVGYISNHKSRAATITTWYYEACLFRSALLMPAGAFWRVAAKNLVRSPEGIHYDVQAIARHFIVSPNQARERGQELACATWNQPT